MPNKADDVVVSAARPPSSRQRVAASIIFGSTTHLDGTGMPSAGSVMGEPGRLAAYRSKPEPMLGGVPRPEEIPTRSCPHETFVRKVFMN